jgi:hypothetical protein
LAGQDVSSRARPLVVRRLPRGQSPFRSTTMAAARLAVFPTRQNLQVMKVKLTGAKKGHSLLKKKADALTMRLRALLKNILQAKEDMGAAFREGNFALAEVKYAAGDVNVMVKESVTSASVSGWRPNPARAHATPWGAPCSLARSPRGPPSSRRGLV